jgi:Bacterial protein of unknown function (DUF882)
LRYAKYALAVVVPISVAFAAHRFSEPEGMDAADVAPRATRPAASPSDTSFASVPIPRPPSRAFQIGAFGHSDAVRVRLVLPNEPVQLPLAFAGATTGMAAQWIGFDGKGNDAVRAWPENGRLIAPSRAGAFWLVISRAGVADTIADFALFVERPMPNAMATGINGYHMGRWPRAAEGAVPRGFIEVTDRVADFALSPHLRMSDFVVHDGQDAFPKYLHVREPLLDKLELTIGEIAAMRGKPAALVKLNVASGFRSPAHNGALSSSAQDSRHMYGDAADIAIDVNEDGALTELDARLVAAAAEVVERKYPDLVGGIGLYYTREGAGWPYVHIDVRGTRARWRGSKRRGVDSLAPGESFDSSAVGASPAAATVPAATAGVAVPAPSPVTPAAQATPSAPPAVKPAAPAAQTPPQNAGPAAAQATPVRPVMLRTLPPTRSPVVRQRNTAPSRRATFASAPQRRVVRTSGRRVQRSFSAPAASQFLVGPVTPRASRIVASARPSASAGAGVSASAIAITGQSAARSADDPFASAARRFRSARP